MSRGRPESERRLEAAHLVVGYAMSRLDRGFLERFGFRTWQSAFETVAKRMDARWKSIKGLRDEFDPIHSNVRVGWKGRQMLPSRTRIVEELKDVSDDALVELVRHILRRDDETTTEVLDVLVPPEHVPATVANRLLTGRKAEEFVLANCQSILGVARASVVDMRDSLLGFDLRLAVNPEVVVEVKGLRERTGSLLFTDREWSEATRRREQYWLVVVGNLQATPEVNRVPDPVRSPRLKPACSFETSLRAVWRTPFALAA